MPEKSNKYRFEEKTTKHIRKLAEDSSIVKKMYYFDSKYEDIPINTSRDILLEKKFTPIKGLVHKFENRVLFLLSYTCVANCRFCERQDRVGVGLDKLGRLKEPDIINAIEYIKNNNTVNEVIFSGGDPLTNPKGLILATKLLEEVKSVKIWRIHTKLPIQMPEKVDFIMLKSFIKKAPVAYFSVHINHPDELTDDVLNTLIKIRKLGFIMLSQSVFLKGINDNFQVLKMLFTTLSTIGVKPYYIYHCQSIPTTSRFVMEIKDEVAIMTKLKEHLSGVAFPSHIIDLQNTTGKVIVPTNHWEFDIDKVKDYNSSKVDLSKYDRL